MKIHGNAKLHPNGRLLMCRRVIEQGWSLLEVAQEQVAECSGSRRAR